MPLVLKHCTKEETLEAKRGARARIAGAITAMEQPGFPCKESLLDSLMSITRDKAWRDNVQSRLKYGRKFTVERDNDIRHLEGCFDDNVWK